MRMLDLYAGHGGASAAQADRGWEVHRVDLAPRAGELGANVTLHRANVLSWRWTGGPVDLLWASPPCTEFARESMPWCRTGYAPSLRLVSAAVLHVERIKPTWWALENVSGSRPHITPLLGEPVAHVGAIWLWGSLPPVTWPTLRPRKEAISGARPDLRSLVPYAVSLALALAVENAKAMTDDDWKTTNPADADQEPGDDERCEECGALPPSCARECEHRQGPAVGR